MVVVVVVGGREGGGALLSVFVLDVFVGEVFQCCLRPRPQSVVSLLTPSTPPSCFNAGTVNAAAADVWSLACLLFVMIKGGPPFSEATTEDEECVGGGGGGGAAGWRAFCATL